MTNGEYLKTLSDKDLGRAICNMFDDCRGCFLWDKCTRDSNALIAWACEERKDEQVGSIE